MIIIGLTGSICSGKRTVAEYIQNCYNFEIIQLDNENPTHGAWNSKDNYDSEEKPKESNAKHALALLEQNPSLNYVIFPITLKEEIQLFRKKTCFLLVGIEAPPIKRYGFYKIKYLKGDSEIQNLAEMDDKLNFGLNGHPVNIYECIYSSDKVILNTGEIEDLYAELRALDLLNPEHFRPSWDTYFIRLAEMAATRSNCMKRPVGAVIVRNNRVISMGYNGTPTGTTNCIDGGCERCNSQASAGTRLEECNCMHAEMNALLMAGKYRCAGGTLYSTLFPCLLCTKGLIQSGVRRLVYNEDYALVESSFGLLGAAGVETVKHSPIVPDPLQ